jgi:hypothetical protein
MRSWGKSVILRDIGERRSTRGEHFAFDAVVAGSSPARLTIIFK